MAASKEEPKLIKGMIPKGPPWNVLSNLKDKSLDELQKLYCEHMNNDKVCCLNLQINSNIGMIIRTATLFGMGEVIIIGRRKYDARATVGADSYIPVNKITATLGSHHDELDIPAIIAHIEEWSKTHQIVFIELTHDAIDFRQIKSYTGDKSVIFIMGCENGGIPTEILAIKNTICAKIPQKGILPCFNVSVAFSIVASMFYYG